MATESCTKRGAPAPSGSTLKIDPNYSLAHDLLGNILAWYSARIGEEMTSNPGGVSIKRYSEERNSYVEKQRLLRQSDQQELAKAVTDYRVVLQNLKSSDHGQE
ncbi:hypothetical protein [Streptosporangium subroseum]|uniref:hypothetical protein n=1 Tax=Streptosporangium subroseum TaxID=106412 RepID=UPI00117D33C5|nr:hypothetical protein [Streptosporangium subroseum]